jgi:hypothetical protein
MTEFGFRVQARFEGLNPSRVPFQPTNHEKGVLLECALGDLPSRVAEPPEVGLHFLVSNLDLPHGGLLHHSPYPVAEGGQPIHMFGLRGRYLFGVRYTNWRDLFPLDLGLMIAHEHIDVTHARHYVELRRTACGQAILGRDGGSLDRPIALQVSNNFTIPGGLRAQQFRAASLAELNAQLS